MRFIDSFRKDFSFFKGNYAVIVASWILVDFAIELPGTYYALYVLKLGATETIIGVIGFASFFALASVQFLGGYLADKFGRKWLISSMTFGWAFCHVFYAIAPSWHFVLTGSVLVNLCLVYEPALHAMVADSLPPEKRGIGFGIIMLIVSASTTPGPFIACILYDQFGLVQGMRIGYGIVVALLLTAAFLRLRLKETMPNTQKPSLTEIYHIYPTALKESFGVWKKVPRSMFYLFISFLIFNFGWSANQLYVVVYAVQELSIDEAVWPLMLTALFVVMIVLAVPAGKAVDKFGRKIPLLVSYVTFMATTWLFITGDLLRVFLSLVLFGVGMILVTSAYTALEADLTPKEQRGKVKGFRSFSTYIVMAIGNLTGGILYEYVSPQLPFFLTMVLFVPSFVLTLTMVQEPEKREE